MLNDKNLQILIDGFNLIFQLGLQGKSNTPFALEKARYRLITELAKRLPQSTRQETLIVFDAKDRPIKSVTDRECVEGMTILYATEHEDADSLIEELIRKHSSPKKLIVVSSDHRLHKAANRRKAKPVDSDVWFDSLDHQTPEYLSPQQKTDDDSELHGYNPFPPGYGEDVGS